MKKLKWKLLHFSTYRNIFFTLLFLSSIVIAMVCVMVFFLFYRSSEKELANISKQMLQQTSYVANIINTQAYDIGNYLVNDIGVTKLLFNKEIDRMEEYHVMRFLTNIQATYPFIHSIGIYNEYTDRYINTKGFTRRNETALIDELMKSKGDMYIRFIPRTLKDNLSAKDINLLTFAIFPGYSTPLPNKGVIILNFDEQYMQDIIGGMKNRNSNSVVLMDTLGNIISKTGGGGFLKNVADQPHIKRVLDSDQSSGSFSMEIENKRSIVTFVQSEELNLYFISINHYVDFLRQVKNLKLSVFGIALLMFLLCILACIFLTNNMHDPINKLLEKITGKSKGNSELKGINEFQILDDEFSNISNRLMFLEPAISIIKKSYLLHYITGSMVDMESRYSETLSSPYFVVVLIKIDSLKEYKQKQSDQVLSLIQFCICNLAMELIGREEQVETIIIQEDEIGILGFLEEDSYSRNLLKLLNELQKNVKSYFNIELTIGIGNIVDASEKIRESYLNAEDAVNERFAKGGGNIYLYDKEVGLHGNEDISIPDNVDKKIIQAINVSNETEIIKEINSFAISLANFSYNQALFIIKKFLFTLHKQYKDLEYIKKNSDELTELIANLPQFDSLEILSKNMKEICCAISKELSEKSKNKNSEMMENVKEYIRTEYFSPNLSLELLADQLQITPGYLGKMFRNYFSVSFNDYLKEVRLEKARVLLIETNETANIISEKVGILNTTYFYTLFRKEYGLSPAKYRSLHNKSKISKEGM